MNIWETSTLKYHALTAEAERGATCEQRCLLLLLLLFICYIHFIYLLFVVLVVVVPFEFWGLYDISQPGQYTKSNNTATNLLRVQHGRQTGRKIGGK